jgi:hypothetical protein
MADVVDLLLIKPEGSIVPSIVVEPVLDVVEPDGSRWNLYYDGSSGFCGGSSLMVLHRLVVPFLMEPKGSGAGGGSEPSAGGIRGNWEQ